MQTGFQYWLKIKYRGKDSHKGDFYADMLRDIHHVRPPFQQNYVPYQPWQDDYAWIKNRLKELDACAAAVETFEELWAEYERSGRSLSEHDLDRND